MQRSRFANKSFSPRRFYSWLFQSLKEVRSGWTSLYLKKTTRCFTTTSVTAAPAAGRGLLASPCRRKRALAFVLLLSMVMGLLWRVTTVTGLPWFQDGREIGGGMCGGELAMKGKEAGGLGLLYGPPRMFLAVFFFFFWFEGGEAVWRRCGVSGPILSHFAALKFIRCYYSISIISAYLWGAVRAYLSVFVI